MVAMPCVVIATVGPMVESQNSGCSKIRTVSYLWRVFDQFEDVLILQVYVLKDFGISRRMWTENLSLSGVDLVVSSCSSSGFSSPQMWRMVSIFPLICVVGSV